MKSGWKSLLNLPLMAWLLFFVLLVMVLDFNGLYGQDAHEYYRYSRSIQNWMLGAEHPGPFFWPVLFPLLGALFEFLPIPGIQFISFLAFAGLIIYCRKILQLSFPAAEKHLDLFLLMTLVMSPFMLRAGIVGMSDMTAAFFISAAYYHFLSFRKRLKSTDIIAFAFFTMSAIATRYASAVILLIPSVVMISDALRRQKFLPLLFAGCTAILPAIPHFLLQQGQETDFMSHHWLMSWAPLNMFHREFLTQEGFISYRIPNLFYPFQAFIHPGFIMFGFLLCIPFITRAVRQKTSIIFVLSFLLYACFLAGIPYQTNRFLIPVFPLVIILIYPAFQWWTERIKWMQKWIPGIVVAGQLLIFSYVFSPVYQLSQLERTVAHALEKKSAASTVYAFYLNGALENYGVRQKLVNLWYEQEGFDPDALVVFHPDKFSEQWKGHPLMQNWQRLNTEHRLVAVEAFEYGWMLYRLEY